MKRRTFLSTVGASIVTLSGCLERASGGIDSTASPDPTPSAGDRQVQVTPVGTVPNEAPFDPSVEVLQSNVNADQTARLEVEITNIADQPVWNTHVRIPAFSKFITQEGPEDRKLLMLQPDEQYSTVRSGCWRADLSESQINHAHSDVVTDNRYEPGETKTTRFDIYGHPENTGACLAPGDYPLEAQYAVSDDSDTETAKWEYRWGFTITIE